MDGNVTLAEFARLLEPFPLEWDAQRVALVAGGWPPIRWRRARSAAQPQFVTVGRRDIRALNTSFQ